VGTQDLAAKSSRLDERPRLNGPWSALRCASDKHRAFDERCASDKRHALWMPGFHGQGGSAQIFTDGISYAAGIGQAPG
jgi:hypothetical protein